MAVFETWLKSDLKKPVQVKPLTGNLFSQDEDGNLIGVEVFDDGSPADLSGGVNGYIIRADGSTVVVIGERSGNKVSILLPAAAYAVVGPISIVIKLSTTTVGACTGYVYRSTTDNAVDPGSVVPDITDLLAMISDCEDATDAANAAADMIDDMTAAATGLDAGASPTVAISEVRGHKHISFGIPKGDPGIQGQQGPQGPQGDPAPADLVVPAVEGWLEDHPEATTTVQDGAISYAKLDSSLKETVDDVSELKDEVNKLDPDASASDVGKALVAKTVSDGKVTEYEFGETAGEQVAVSDTQPTDENNVLWINEDDDQEYVVPTYTEFQALSRQKINEPSIEGTSGQVLTTDGNGGRSWTTPQSGSGSEVIVSGSTPSIAGVADTRYICGEVSTLSIVAPASGIISVFFESGSSATVLTVTSAKTGVTAIKWTNSFNPASLDSNTFYEINIADGEYGVVGSWT